MSLYTSNTGSQAKYNWLKHLCWLYFRQRTQEWQAAAWARRRHNHSVRERRVKTNCRKESALHLQQRHLPGPNGATDHEVKGQCPCPCPCPCDLICYILLICFVVLGVWCNILTYYLLPSLQATCSDRCLRNRRCTGFSYDIVTCACSLATTLGYTLVTSQSAQFFQRFNDADVYSCKDYQAFKDYHSFCSNTVTARHCPCICGFKRYGIMIRLRKNLDPKRTRRHHEEEAISASVVLSLTILTTEIGAALLCSTYATHAATSTVLKRGAELGAPIVFDTSVRHSMRCRISMPYCRIAPPLYMCRT